MPDTTIIVVAGEHDDQAGLFAQRYRGEGVRLLSPADLSRRGWDWRIGHPLSARAVSSRQALLSRNICGVVTRLPWVTQWDLPHIRPEEREYVAAEMSAFLLGWLESLPAPLLNRPSAQCLSGTCWRHEQWVKQAAGLGIPAVPTRTHLSFGETHAPAQVAQPDGITITVVGDTVIGDADPLLKRHALRLTAAARVELLALRFNSAAHDAAFSGASLWPDLCDPVVGGAILNYFAEAFMQPRTAAAR